MLFLGETSYLLPTPDPTPTLTLQRMALCLRVGPLAPSVLLGLQQEDGAGADWRQIEHVLKLLCVSAEHVEHARDRLTATARAFLHVGVHASQIEAVACGLLEQKTLTGAEITEICAANGKPITPWRPNDAAKSALKSGSFADVSLTLSR